MHEVTPAARQKACRYRTPSTRSPRNIALEALALGYSSWRSKPQASRLLPRRIYVPIQPANFTTKRQAVLPIGSTSGHRKTENIQIAYRESRQRELKTVTTTYCGHLTKVHTPIALLFAMTTRIGRLPERSSGDLFLAFCLVPECIHFFKTGLFE